MKRLEVEVVTSACALVRGYGARELVKDAVGRFPVWATRSRGWVVQPHQVPDIEAEAERQGYVLVTQAPMGRRPGDSAEVIITEPAAVEREDALLW